MEPDDSPPRWFVDLDPFETGPHDPSPRRLKPRKTPRLHLERVARHSAWIAGLRALDGEPLEHGPVEVLDGEIAPAGALDGESPVGARVYENTGNEGASVEMQYRRAVLVLWRRNDATLRMLARCGGRLALATEVKERRTKFRDESEVRGRLTDALALWSEALECDGGGPAPQAHRIVLGLIDDGNAARNRASYLEQVAAIDLDAEAVPELVAWITERIDAGEAVDGWTKTLRQAMPAWHPMNGAPALLKALCATEKTQHIAIAMLGARKDAPTTVEAVLEQAEQMEGYLAEDAWRRRRRAKMTADSGVDASE